MPDSNLSDKNFYIGICMAGAVSAGAYTAGVIDYLLEALTEWERRKKEGKEGKKGGGEGGRGKGSKAARVRAAES